MSEYTAKEIFDHLGIDEEVAIAEQCEAWETSGMNTLLTRIHHLAIAARPIDDNDWASESQVAAQNAFFIALEEVLSPEAFEQLERYCDKATVDEMIDEGLRVAASAS